MSMGGWWNRQARKHSDSDFKAMRAEKNSRKKPKAPVDSVYRYFDREEYAEAFARGEVFISTLKRCREYEDPLQGDKEEAYEHYNSGRAVTGDGSDPDFVAFAAKCGVRVAEGARGITIVDNTMTTYLADAFVLCTTLGFVNDLSESFGKYCVKISSVDKFARALTVSLNAKYKLAQSAHGMVSYQGRHYKELENSPGLLGFVKPADPYAPQREYRFLWTALDPTEIKGCVVLCPEISQYVTRVK